MYKLQIPIALPEETVTVLNSHPTLSPDIASENEQNFSEHKYRTHPQLQTAFTRVMS